MLANPSADFYDDDDDYDDDDYDEDDVPAGKIQITAAEAAPEKAEEELMNEEGSGQGRFGGSGYDRFRAAAYKNRMKADYRESARRKGKEEKPVDAESDEEEVGSGKFANDNDDEEYDDDEYGFFSSKRKQNSRYFRKNTNDAIKIISTPLGKVGIVYKQTDDKNDDASRSLATDADTESRRVAPKITPVLTADGKVALLYRGDSESTKYEPILNLTHKFNIFDNKTQTRRRLDDDEVDEGYDEDEEEVVAATTVREELPETTSTPQNPLALDVEHDNSILPMINRPLSEVLGIKKNQFRQFRIKDDGVTSTGKPTADADQMTVNLGGYFGSKVAPNVDFDFGRDATMLDERNERTNRVDSQQDAQSEADDTTIATQDVLSKTEVVNLAIIPHFDEEFERQQHLREHEGRRHHRPRHRYRHLNEDLSGIHCIMQAMMGIAAISTVFGMLGAFFKQRILDQLRMIHW